MKANDQEFFDLAMKAIAKQVSPEEQAELNDLLRQPDLQQEFTRLQAEARLAKEVLPLLSATEAREGKVPGYARARLKTKVRQTFGKSEQKEQGEQGLWVSLFQRWQWKLGLVGATAVVVLAATLFFRTPEPMIQLAMLDSVGGTRGGTSNLVAVLEQQWKQTKVQTYSESADLNRWLEDWPVESKKPVVKIVYDRDAGEVRVSGRSKGKPPFQKTFPCRQGQDLPGVLTSVGASIREQH